MRSFNSNSFRMDRLEARTLLAAGDFDPTFASIGYLTHSLGKTSDAVDGIEDSNNLIVQVGNVAPASGGDKLGSISRYTAAGLLDTSFGTAGFSAWSMGAGDTIATGVAEQADGKYVVVGFVGSGASTDMFICRFTDLGVLDTTFSSDGKLLIDFNGGADFGTGIAVSGTNIFASGGSLGTGGGGLVCVGVDATGAPVPGFGVAGEAIILDSTVDFINDSAVAYVGGRMVIDGAGRPVIAATKVTLTLSTLTLTSSEMGVCRATVLGEPDTTFASVGFKSVTFSRTFQLGTSVAIDSRTGKIVLVGTTANGTAAFGTPLPTNFAPIKAATRANFTVARFKVGGGKDTTFSEDGKLQVDFGEFRLDGASDVVVDSTGRIIVSGGSQIRKSASRFAVARLSPGGALDATFADSGQFLEDIGGSDGFFGNAIQVDGKYLFFGHTKVSGTRGKLVVVRLLDA